LSITDLLQRFNRGDGAVVASGKTPSLTRFLTEEVDISRYCASVEIDINSGHRDGDIDGSWFNSFTEAGKLVLLAASILAE
jgi:hypothetical protein